MKRLTPFDFIEKATNIHGDKYDYSKIKHVYASEKVSIICKKHNSEFQQRPADHLRGNGCPICSGKKKKTTEEFIQDARKIHGEKYSYDKVNYITGKTKVVITCKIHGDFEQNPNNHLNGLGCDKCGGTYKITREEFIEKAKEIHAGKYSYDKVNYINQNTPVSITCHQHGDFEQQPRYHLKGFGCKSCSGKKKKTTEEFIKKAKEVHADKYGYDKVNYVNGKTKVIITCKIHGDFQQTASEHIKGKGCHACGGTQSLTTESFITKAKQIHNSKYCYDKVKYTNNRTKVTITCPVHGDFEQSPSSHLDGRGCLLCSGLKKLTTEEFIEKAKQVHGNKYRYDKVKYISTKTKVIITCPIHGNYEQAPANHLLQQHGCPSCGGSENLTTEEFIKRAKQIHGDRYKYDNVNYINTKTKVSITCPFHGAFEQSPSNHLRGDGCRKCKSPKGEVEIERVLKKLNIKFETQFTFDDCIDKRKLPFDFAVFINGKTGLIEFHGQQHYDRVYFGNTDKQHEEAQVRDNIKEEYAQKNSIPLLIIPYSEIDTIKQTVEKFVNKEFYGQLHTTPK